MPESVTPLTARSQTLISVLLGLIAVMGTSPFVAVFASRWPLRFAELPWRYDLLGSLLVNLSQAVVLVALIAIIGAFAGNRIAVRAASIIFGLLAVVQIAVALFLVLDYFQVRRLLAASRTPKEKMVMIQTLLFFGIATAGAAWGCVAAWRASVREGAGHRRKQGEGLVVGQPKESRPPS